MASTQKWVGDLEICQDFVNSVTEIFVNITNVGWGHEVNGNKSVL